MGTFMHATEGEMLCTSSMADKVPHFNAPIYLANKSAIGKIDEILGPINEVYFSVKRSFPSGSTLASRADLPKRDVRVWSLKRVVTPGRAAIKFNLDHHRRHPPYPCMVTIKYRRSATRFLLAARDGLEIHLDESDKQIRASHAFSRSLPMCPTLKLLIYVVIL